MKNEKISDNKRNCISMRMGEKKILKFYFNFSEYCLVLIGYNDEEVFFLFIFFIF